MIIRPEFKTVGCFDRFVQVFIAVSVVSVVSLVSFRCFGGFGGFVSVFRWFRRFRSGGFVSVFQVLVHALKLMVVKIPLESLFIFPSSKVTSNSSFLFSNLRFSCFNTNALYCSSRTWSWIILRVFLFRSLGFLFEGTIAFSTATSVTSSSSSASTGALKCVLSTSFAVASSAFCSYGRKTKTSTPILTEVESYLTQVNKHHDLASSVLLNVHPESVLLHYLSKRIARAAIFVFPLSMIK